MYIPNWGNPRRPNLHQKGPRAPTVVPERIKCPTWPKCVVLTQPASEHKGLLPVVPPFGCAGLLSKKQPPFPKAQIRGPTTIFLPPSPFDPRRKSPCPIHLQKANPICEQPSDPDNSFKLEKPAPPPINKLSSKFQTLFCPPGFKLRKGLQLDTQMVFNGENPSKMASFCP